MTDLPASPDFGFPPINLDGGRITSNADIKREIDYQAAEYDLDEASAMENVADEYGLPFAEVQARYSGRADLMPKRYTSDDPALPYTLITQHEPDRRAVTRHFPTWEDAKAAGEATNPDTDGSMVPNVDKSIGEHPEYESGLFWPRHENKYAAIHKRRY